MKNGEQVAAFEREFAAYVSAKYAIALCNGTVTLHTALAALGVQPGDRVAVPPLTMAATTIAVLQAGAVPVFVDVLPNAWIMNGVGKGSLGCVAAIPVSLYGLALPEWRQPERTIDDAAQTIRKHSGCAFTSYSFQASKILALGEGGMLVTDSEELAVKAREFSSLGYRMRADQPRIDPNVIKSPAFERHHSVGWNYRMNDLTAEKGWRALQPIYLDRNWTRADALLRNRHECAAFYRAAIAGCDWITPQFVPEGATHDHWTYAVALKSAAPWQPFTDAIVKHGGERPYGAWRLTYDEPFLRGKMVTMSMGGVAVTTNDPLGFCPVAESLQPRLVQGQTNDLASAERNANAWRAAIADIGGP